MSPRPTKQSHISYPRENILLQIYQIQGKKPKWLEEIIVITTSQKRANKILFKYFNETYPEYKNYVQLF